MRYAVVMFTGESSRAWFPSTQWSMIRAAAHGAPQALENLCQKYLRAVYAYFRKDGCDRERAADLTQEFFTVKILDPDKREALLRSAGQASVKCRLIAKFFRHWRR